MTSPTDANARVIPHPRRVPARRNMHAVPYVEMFDGKLQGVVSSGSDASRVYCSWIDSDGDFYCSTNNNRPCGGLRGGGCKHIDSMITNAIAQFDGDEVARFLGIKGDPGSFNNSRAITSQIRGSLRKEPANAVFSRFLNYLRYTELEGSCAPMPEMAWFITG